MTKWFFLAFFFLFQTNIEAQLSDFKSVNFENADKIALNLKGADLSNLPGLAYNLTNGLTSDVEKFRAIYTWVCTNIENDYYGYRKNHSKRIKFQKDTIEQYKWNAAFSKQVFIKLLKEKKTICTGYAYLIKNLANLANIKCELVDGYGRNENTATSELKFPNHTWNAVKLNDKWYLCDATWSSGAFNLGNYAFEFDYNDGYFLATPELFAKDHLPNDSSWSLLNNSIPISDFFNSPIVYDNAYKYSIFPMEPALMRLEVEKNKELSFIVKDLKGIDVNTIYIQINSGKNTQLIKPKIEHLKNDTLKIKYSFAKAGLYDFHININNHPFCTYVISVKKKI